MTAIEEGICSTPDTLRRTMQRVEERADLLAPALRGPVIFLGCGSSCCVGAAAAALYEMQRDELAQGIIGPIATADTSTLVWCLVSPDDVTSAAVLDDIRQTGATVRCVEETRWRASFRFSFWLCGWPKLVALIPTYPATSSAEEPTTWVNSTEFMPNMCTQSFGSVIRLLGHRQRFCRLHDRCSSH
jgi:hypothetical protein